MITIKIQPKKKKQRASPLLLFPPHGTTPASTHATISSPPASNNPNSLYSKLERGKTLTPSCCIFVIVLVMIYVHMIKIRGVHWSRIGLDRPGPKIEEIG